MKSPLFLLTTVHTVKIKVEILQDFVAFSEYVNFTYKNWTTTTTHKVHIGLKKSCSDGTVIEMLDQLIQNFILNFKIHHNF